MSKKKDIGNIELKTVYIPNVGWRAKFGVGINTFILAPEVYEKAFTRDFQEMSSKEQAKWQVRMLKNLFSALRKTNIHNYKKQIHKDGKEQDRPIRRVS